MLCSDTNYAWGLYKLERFRRVEEEDKDAIEQAAIEVVTKKKTDTNKEAEEREPNKVIKDVIRTYITEFCIVEPKRVRYNSFNEFFGKCCSITHFTIGLNYEEKKDIFAKSDNVLVQTNEKVIEEKELYVIEFVDKEEANNSTTNNFRCGDDNKF